MKPSVKLILITVLLSSAATIMALKWNVLPGYTEKDTPPPALASTRPGQPALSSEEETNIRVYAQVSPGVVNVTRTVFEYDFFFAPIAADAGTGSGCVLDKEGNILTNYHVIESADRLEVSLPDHTKYRAALVGVDTQNDLAVIRISGAPKERLHPIVLGNSGSLKVGQKVFAIGNPLGLQNTMTTGIVSSLGRRIKTEEGTLVDDVIQTDAAINPGNSGGPLLNTSGEMIGINTSIFTIRGGGSIGIGFAIPANTIRRVATQLIQKGRVSRPWFGIEGYELDEASASDLGLPVHQGILITRVYRGSSADEAGIRGYNQVVILYNQRVGIGGDILTEIDGKPVNSLAELTLFLESKHPGDTVQATLYRGRSKIQKSVVLVEEPRQNRMNF